MNNHENLIEEAGSWVAHTKPSVVGAILRDMISALVSVRAERDAALARIADLEQGLRSESLGRGIDATLLREYERRFAEATKLHQCFDAPNGFRWCSGCSTDEYPEEWPCPTAVALGLNEGEDDD